jgi:hypothetical protein
LDARQRAASSMGAMQRVAGSVGGQGGELGGWPAAASSVGGGALGARQRAASSVGGGGAVVRQRGRRAWLVARVGELGGWPPAATSVGGGGAVGVTQRKKSMPRC